MSVENNLHEIAMKWLDQKPKTLSDLAFTLGLVVCSENHCVHESHTACKYVKNCPFCVSGWTPDPEIVEIVAKHWEEGYDGYPADKYRPDEDDLNGARAGLLAYLAWIEERL